MLLQAPKDLIENKRFRLKILRDAEEDVELQQMIIRYCAKGQQGFEFFVDTFCWTYDPREVDSHLPFVLWPKQREFIAWLEILYQRSQLGEKVNIAVDKPRGIGATYTLMVWVLWHYIFHDFSARVGSRKEDYVDKPGDPDTLFYKFDYNLERMPKWLLRGVHDRSHMVLKPAGAKGVSANSVTGESANPNFGRGGRKSVMLFDEFGFWDWAKSSWESTGEATNLRIAISTPPETGKDSHHYKLLTNQAGRVHKFNFDWQDDPRRDSKWLAEAKATKSDEEFAREVMKSYEGTTLGKVYAVNLRHAELEDFDYNPTFPLFCSWDFGLDMTTIIWWQKDMATNRVFMLDAYSNSNKDILFYEPFVNGKIDSGQYEYTQNELEIIQRHSKWSRTITHYGGPDVKKRSIVDDKTSAYSLLMERGIIIQFKEWGGRTWQDHKEITNLLFRRLVVNEKWCEPVLAALRGARYPQKREGSQSTSGLSKPVHDWTSHYRTAVEYFADNEPITLRTKTVVGNVSQESSRKQVIKTAEQVDKEWEDMRKRVEEQTRTVLGNSTPNRGNSHRVL